MRKSLRVKYFTLLAAALIASPYAMALTIRTTKDTPFLVRREKKVQKKGVVSAESELTLLRAIKGGNWLEVEHRGTVGYVLVSATDYSTKGRQSRPPGRAGALGGSSIRAGAELAYGLSDLGFGLGGRLAFEVPAFGSRTHRLEVLVSGSYFPSGGRASNNSSAVLLGAYGRYGYSLKSLVIGLEGGGGLLLLGTAAQGATVASSGAVFGFGGFVEGNLTDSAEWFFGPRLFLATGSVLVLQGGIVFLL